MTPADLHRNARRLPPWPAELTLDQLCALPPDQVATRSGLVRAAVRGLYIEHVRLAAAAELMNAVVSDNAASLPGAKTFVAITGPNLVGKSTFVRQWLVDHYRRMVGPGALAKPEPPVWTPSDSLDADYVPVAYVNLASAALRGSLSMEILAAIGLNVAKPPPTHRLVAALRHCGTRLVVLDDMHFLRTHKQLGREALDHVKKLNNELGEYGGTIVMVGADLEATELWNDRQITGRLHAINIPRFTDTTADEREDWQRLLRSFETSLVPLLPASPQAVLSRRSAGLLLRRTQGSIRDLHELLVVATHRACSDQTWGMTPALLESATFDTTISAQTRDQVATQARRRTTVTTGTRAVTARKKARHAG